MYQENTCFILWLYNYEISETMFVAIVNDLFILLFLFTTQSVFNFNYKFFLLTFCFCFLQHTPLPTTNHSIIDDLSAFSQADTFEALRPTTLELDEAGSSDQITSIQSPTNNNLNSLNNNNNEKNNAESQPSTDPTDEASSPSTSSLAALQLTAGFMQLYSPPLAKARTQLKELM